MGYALLPALLEGLVDGGAVAVGAVGDLREGEPKGLLIEDVGPCGFGGDGDHLGPASIEGRLAVPVGAGDDPDLLVAVPAADFRRLERGMSWAS